MSNIKKKKKIAIDTGTVPVPVLFIQSKSMKKVY